MNLVIEVPGTESTQTVGQLAAQIRELDEIRAVKLIPSKLSNVHEIWVETSDEANFMNNLSMLIRDAMLHARVTLPDSEKSLPF